MESLITKDLNKLIDSGRKYSVIMADPPWAFKVWSKKGQGRSAESHYPTQTLDIIKRLPVAKLAADECSLFLWTVGPQNEVAFEVIRAWGFEYKTWGFGWVKFTKNGKLHTGMGYHTRSNMELCLLATKGKNKRLSKAVQQAIVEVELNPGILAKVGTHSKKPYEVRARIEKLLAGPYLELYGRRPYDGWTVFGNQITKSIDTRHIPEL